MSLIILDGNSVAQTFKTSTSGGELVPHHNVDTVVGPVSFDARGDLANPSIAWFKWVDGRYVEVDPKTLLPPVLDTTP